MFPVAPAKKALLVLCLLLCLSMIGKTAVPAEEAKLSGLVITNTQDELLVFTTIKNAFSEEIQAAIKNGIPATFSFLVSLNNTRTMWPDKTITEKKETHTMAYDPVKGKYLVTRSWESDKPFITDSFEEACERMCKIEGLVLARTDKLEKNATYFVKARAELDKMSLPFYLHYVLFFVSCWDVETDWQEVYFKL